MTKPKIALYWCASCGGCEEAVVDLNEDILKVVDAVDIALWPVAVDAKYSDIEAMEDGEIAVSLINGAVRTEEQEKIVKLLRKKSGMVIAFGSCACSGGIPALANQWTRESIFDWVYSKAPSVVNSENTVPKTVSESEEGEKLTLPEFYNTVHSLAQVIDVDYYIPGCPPTPEIIMAGIEAILSGELPPKGSYIGVESSLCKSCERNDSKPEQMSVSEIKRPHLTEMDPEKCFLDQGIICMGPATQGGCGELCINANMPCRGCFGPPRKIADQGGSFVSVLSSIFGVEGEEKLSEEEVEKLMNSVPDPLGTFYRFSMSDSILKRKMGE